MKYSNITATLPKIKSKTNKRKKFKRSKAQIFQYLELRETPKKIFNSS